MEQMLTAAPAAAADASRFVDDALTTERTAAARRVVDAIRGTDFEREFRRLKAQASVAGVSAGPVTADEVLDIVGASERPASATEPAVADASPATGASDADGLLAFLKYMLSMRWSNVQTYMGAYTLDANAAGVETVFGALVDFDYWLDCHLARLTMTRSPCMPCWHACTAATCSRSSRTTPGPISR